jgi:hypothetical protein
MRSVSYVKDSIRFLKRLLSWVAATARWLWDGNRLWLPALAAIVIGVLVLKVVPVIWPCHVERVVRFVGGLLQLGGVITIVLKLRGAHRQFPGQMLTVWWQHRPRFRQQKTVVMAAGAASISMATGSARGRVRAGPQATLEQRLAMLEDSYTKLFDEVGSLGNEVKRRSDELSSKLRAEATAREAADKKIEEQLKETAVGSLHLDVWGVEFFILGTIAGTLSQEIAAVFGAAWCE